MNKKLSWFLGVPALIALWFVGCAPLQDILLPEPSVPGEWRALLAQVRAFERRIGFRETGNFNALSDVRSAYTLCGHTPRFQLPYSYEDPALRWVDATSVEDCRAAAGDNDMYFTHIEAVGEVGAALTSQMVHGKLDRFLYLLIHEDCHDQFDFPYGFEEALCNLVGYKGMAQFAREKYGPRAREDRAIRRYTDTQSYLTRSVVGYYRDLERLYARHARREIATEALLIERARIFGGAERTFGWPRRTLNNVGLANEMTYSRHYPLVEAAHERLGGDLARTIAFFKRVDQAKPTRAAVMRATGVDDPKDVRFVRAYEAAAVQTTTTLLAQYAGNTAAARPPPERIK